MRMTMTVACCLVGVLSAACAEAANRPDHDANPVPAIGQNAADVKGARNAGHPRVLILGNSITRHGPRPEIGWTNDFGMAASSIDRDFAHVLAAKVKAEFPAASFALSNVAGTFERQFQKGLDLDGNFGWMHDWQPDAVVFFFGANCPKTYDVQPDGAFGRALTSLRNYLANGGKTRFLVCEGFYDRPVLDAEKRAMAEKYGDTVVPMGDIRARDDVRGRYNHPSDNGMRLIAERIWDRLEPAISDRGPMHLYGPVNFDPAKVGPYVLEDPLAFADGTPLKSAAEWPRRRAEILDIFAREMYGQPPPPPEAFVWEVVSEKVVFAGFARFRHVRTWFKADKSGPSVNWYVVLPRFAKKPAPPIIFLNFRGVSEYLPNEDVPLMSAWNADKVDYEKSRGRYCNPNETSYCPLPMLLARGYAVMTACYCEVSPDPFPWKRDSKPPKGAAAAFPYVGVFELWPKRDETRTDNTTALGAWAWALSRGLDLAERMPDTDATKAVVTGCSRLGKAALIAAARDERFKVCVVNQSGGGGVTLTKHALGESPKTEMTTFRHWFCTAYDKYVERPETMAFDQHLFVAAIAPRALLVEGFDDYWYDTEGEYLSLKAASPVWKFLGGKGLPDGAYPAEMETSAIGADLGYVRRYRHHGISAYDWTWLLDFADRALELGY